MQYTVYIDDDTSRQLSEAALKRGANRNAIILHALQEWLAAQRAAEALNQASARPIEEAQAQSASYY
ncbi:MAG TPA: ribbon-helix-helix domain-containing protein [Candidatus Aquabacterium excrementipullorum]|nr:ribbon-helix-helix domain-containing protein [Candidatus Aquabacterium excrementipullorum]